MFYNCSSLKELDISSFIAKVWDNILNIYLLTDNDTSNVTRVDFMLESCAAIEELNLDHFKVTDMSSEFIKEIECFYFQYQ